MTDFIQAYLDLLIFQYRDKPNASAEITAIVNPFNNIFDLYSSFEKAFDVDTGIGKQLDVLGRIVGQNRLIEQAIPREYFGFVNKNSNAKSFGYPFFKKGDDLYAKLELNDSEYRFFIKLRIAKNNMQNNIFSISNLVFWALNGYGYVENNHDMTLTFNLHESFDINFGKLFVILDMLPRPMGIRYNNFIYIYDDLGNKTTYSL